MKLITDLTPFGRPVRPTPSWRAPYLAQPGGIAPALVLDFATGAYGVGVNQLPFGTLVSLTRASTGTYFDANGAMQTAAVDAPRFDHDPLTGAALGLRIEPARTNLALKTNDMTGSTLYPWNANRTYSTLMGMGSVKTTADTNAFVEFFPGNVVVAPGMKYIFSFWAVSENSASLRWLTNTAVRDDTNGINFPADGFTVDGVAVASSGNRTIIPLSPTPKFITLAFTAPAGSTAIHPRYMWDQPVAGDKFEFAGAQVEAGEWPSTYIPTGAAAVTRASDLAHVTLGSWFNPNAGTIIAHARDLAPFSSSQRIIGTASQEGNLYKTSSGVASTGPGPTYLVRSGAAPTAGLHKFGFSYAAAGGRSLTYDGLAPVSDTNMPFATAPTGFWLLQGNGGASAYMPGGCMSRLVCYSGRISDEMLRSMTI